MKFLTAIFFAAILLVSTNAFSDTGSPGKGIDATVVLSYGSTSVGTSSWVSIAGPLAYSSTEQNIFDSSGQSLELGASNNAGTISRVLIIPPGGPGETYALIQAGATVYVRALSGTASSGSLLATIYQ